MGERTEQLCNLVAQAARELAERIPWRPPAPITVQVRQLGKPEAGGARDSHALWLDEPERRDLRQIDAPHRPPSRERRLQRVTDLARGIRRGLIVIPDQQSVEQELLIM